MGGGTHPKGPASPAAAAALGELIALQRCDSDIECAVARSGDPATGGDAAQLRPRMCRVCGDSFYGAGAGDGLDTVCSGECRLSRYSRGVIG